MAIYVDNAATTRLSEKAMEAMLPYMREMFGNPSSLHSVGQKANVALVSARETVARCLGAESKEITFTSGGSEADNQAIRSAAVLGAKAGKKHIISTVFEHPAVLNTLKSLEDEGFAVTLLGVGENGRVTPEQVKEAIRIDTCLVSVMFANNEIGTLQPIREIGAVCKEKNVLFHTDAVQAVGHVDVDVKKMNIDLLSLSAHKFHGPKGVGVLYARKGIPLVPVIYGGAQERGKRAGTENIPGIVGMAKALEESVLHLEENRKKVTHLRDKVMDALLTVPGAVLNGDREHRLPGNVNFSFAGIEGESLLLLLDEQGISVSSGSACASGSLEPSHVLLAIGRPKDLANGAIRISLSEENTEEEIDRVIQAVKETVSRLRR